MDLSFIWDAAIVLSVGFCLLRILGKKTVGEMTGLEIITLLAMASVTGHAVKTDGLWRTVVTLCIFVILLVTIQYLAIKFNRIEKWFMGSATLVLKDGKPIHANLKKLRISVDQLEAKIRVKGIASFSDIKTATIEMSGDLGYELTKQAKPVTFGELEQLLSHYQRIEPPKQNNQTGNLFSEVVHREHQHSVDQELR